MAEAIHVGNIAKSSPRTHQFEKLPFSGLELAMSSGFLQRAPERHIPSSAGYHPWLGAHPTRQFAAQPEHEDKDVGAGAVLSTTQRKARTETTVCFRIQGARASLPSTWLPVRRRAVFVVSESERP
jgi:hypothetical protein